MTYKEQGPNLPPLPPTGPGDSSVAAAWTEFLGTYAWCVYVTLTFRIAPSAERAHKTFRRWLHPINHGRFGRNYYKYHDGVPWARCSERQRRGALHYHVLIGACPRLDIGSRLQLPRM